MSQFKLDFQKLFDLQILLIEADPDLSHLFRQMLAGLGIKKIDAIRTIDELNQRDAVSPFDIVLLDYDIDEQISAAEIISRLIVLGALPHRSKLVLISAHDDYSQLTLEFPYHYLSQLSRPFHKVALDNELKSHVLYQPFLKPLLTLAGLNRYSDCLKLLLHTQQQSLPPGLDSYLLRLRCQLLMELYRFDTVVSLIRTPVQEQQGWALWMLYRLRYERGDLQACQAFLLNSSEELAKFTERRDLWLIYLALQNRDTENASVIASQIPYVGMNSSMVQLVFLLLMQTGQIERAEQFIERKRRLAGRGGPSQILAVTHIVAVFSRFCDEVEQSVDDTTTELAENTSFPLSQITALLQPFRENSLLMEPQTRQLLEIFASRFSADLNTARSALTQMLAGVDWSTASVQLICQTALICAKLQLQQLIPALLIAANQQIQQLPDNCNRLYAACLYQYALNQTLATTDLPVFYQQLLTHHLKTDQVFAAAKTLRQAISLEPERKDLKEQLHQMMRNLGLQRFRGINLPAQFD